MHLSFSFAIASETKVLKETDVDWPWIKFSSWAKAILADKSSLLLGGHSKWQIDLWSYMLKTFWERFRATDCDHPIYKLGYDLAHTIPVMLHGDEGTGMLELHRVLLSVKLLKEPT